MEGIKNWWNSFAEKHPAASKWIREGGLFVIVSNLITVMKFFILQFLPYAFEGMKDVEFGWPGIPVSLFGVGFDWNIFGYAVKYDDAGQAIVGGGLGYVFCQENGQPYEPRTYQDLFKRCVRQAGIADANLHSLRHTFATRALEQGMDVVTLSRLLGHATPSITLDKYGHALNDHKRASMEKLGDIYGGGKSFAPPAPDVVETEEQGYGFEFGMRF